MSFFNKGQRLFASAVLACCTATLVFLGCRPAVPTLSVISFPDYFMPKEGAVMILDGVAILAKAPHRDLAEKFLNHLLDPKMAAQTANTLRAPTPNRAALEFIRAEDRTNRAIYPPADQLDRLEMVRDVGEHTRLYDEIWSQIKSR